MHDTRGMSLGWESIGSATTHARKVLRSGRVQTAEEKADYLKGFHAAELDYQRRSGKGGGGGGHGGGRRRAMRQEHRHAA